MWFWSVLLSTVFIWSDFYNVAPDQASQTWDSPLLSLYCRGLDVLSPGKHHALYSESKQHKSAFIKLYKPHYRHKGKKVRNQVISNDSPWSWRYIRPCEFAGPLTGRHALQYLSMKGMMSFTREQTTPLKPHIKRIALHSLNYSGKRTLSLENIVLGCSSWVLDLHVRFAKAVRHISFRSVDKTIKQWRMGVRGSMCWMQYRYRSYTI